MQQTTKQQDRPVGKTGPHQTADRAPGDARKAMGAYGERVAAAILERRGYRIVARNWRCREGEIDLVVIDGSTLVVVEVKARRAGGFVSPAEAVTPHKAARLRRLTGAFLQAHPDLVGSTRDLRIDVIAVSLPVGGPASVEHLVGVA